MKITRRVFHAGFGVLGVFLFFAVASPAARAQLVPVSLTKEVVADSKIPSPNVLAPLPPLPRREPRRAVKEATLRAFFVLSAGVYVAAGLELQQSESMLPNFDERDPVVRPFLRLPAPAYYASAALFATGINFLGWKMTRSERGHKVWWLPQVTSMAGNLAGYGYTRAHPAPR
jgi:hypothetical protein